MNVDAERKHIENKQLEESWQMCCSKSDRHFIKYVVQVAMGASVIIFSMIQIATGNQENNEIYFSLLSGTMAYFLPSPSMKPA